MASEPSTPGDEHRPFLPAGNMATEEEQYDDGPVDRRSTMEMEGTWQSSPAPPPDLWDTDDSLYLEKVSCNCRIRIVEVSPKAGQYSIRMKCHWRFRTLNTADRTETHLKVPGVRMPGLIVDVDESRIWRDLEKTRSTDKTVYWRGISVFVVRGFEIFEMSDFPFDRQVINLELMEFVWRPSKDSATYDTHMNLVSFVTNTQSMLPEWTPWPAKVEMPDGALMETNDRNTGPSFASRFHLRLRMERKHWFFVMQIFAVTFMILLISIFPLALPPTEDFVGTRLTAYATGILTLVSFKYGISAQLPRVPYSTFTDMYLLSNRHACSMCRGMPCCLQTC